MAKINAQGIVTDATVKKTVDREPVQYPVTEKVVERDKPPRKPSK